MKTPKHRAILKPETAPAFVRVRTLVPLGEHPPGAIITLPASEAEALGTQVTVLE